MHRITFLFLITSLACGLIVGWHVPHVILRHQLIELATRCDVAERCDEYSIVNPPFSWDIEARFRSITGYPSFEPWLCKLDEALDSACEIVLKDSGLKADLSSVDSYQLCLDSQLFEKYDMCKRAIYHHFNQEHLHRADAYAQIAMQIHEIASPYFVNEKQAYIKRHPYMKAYTQFDDSSFAEHLLALGRYSDSEDVVETYIQREELLGTEYDVNFDWSRMTLTFALLGQHKNAEALVQITKPSTGGTFCNYYLGPCLLAVGDDAAAKYIGIELRQYDGYDAFDEAIHQVPDADNVFAEKIADDIIDCHSFYRGDPTVPAYLEIMSDIMDSRGHTAAAEKLSNEVNRIRSQ